MFEQSYGGVEGDSASAAELFALLSALSETPIRQSYAVTGSVDQHGHIQAIGGVNEKIEGFFDVCRARGLTRTPRRHHPCRQCAAPHASAPTSRTPPRRDSFRVIAIETIDQGIELLTGVPAGEPDMTGRYTEGTLNGRVAVRLAQFARRSLPPPPNGKGRRRRRGAESGHRDD